MQKVDIIVKNATIITMNEERKILTNAGLAVKEGKILDIGTSREIVGKYYTDKMIDASDKFIFPGMIDTHSHLFQVLFKGVGKEMKLLDWLACAIEKPYFNISEEDIYLAALVGCMDHLKSGATTVLDFQYAHGRPNLSDAVIQAFEDVGIRGILGRSHTDSSYFPKYSSENKDETEDEYFEDVKRLYNKHKNSSTIDIAMAPDIVWTMSEEGYRESARLSKELNIFNTIHMLETEEDNEFCKNKYGLTTVDFYEKTGILDSKLLAVHCALITKEEIKKLKQYDVKVSYNAISNMMMGYQTCPVKDLIEAGITVGIAMDGAASNDNQNMLNVLKISPLWQKAFYRNPSVIPATKILEMATIDGADAVFKKNEIGSIEIGKKADFFVFNPKFCNTVPIIDPVVSLVYGAGENNIETTVVNGKIVLEQGRILRVDEEKIIWKLQKAAFELREKSGVTNYLWNQKISVPPFNG